MTQAANSAGSPERLMRKLNSMVAEMMNRLANLSLKFALHFGKLQVLHQVQRGAEQHLVSRLQGLVADPTGQAGLAPAGRTDND